MAWGRPLAVADSTLRAQVLACMVSVVPVSLEADGTEVMPARNGHRVSQVLFAEIADVLLVRHGFTNRRRL